MLKNIITYLILLICSFLFCVSYFRWFSYFVFIVILLIPFVSLAFSLPFMIKAVKSGFQIYTNDEFICGDSLVIGVSCKKDEKIFCPIMKIEFKLNNQFSKTSEKTKFIFAGFFNAPQKVTSKIKLHCGYIRITAKKGKIYDFLGLFFITFNLNFNKEIAIMPKENTHTKLPDIDLRKIIGYKQKKSGGFSDDYELRPFRPGDNLKNIHWKLSVKTDELFVREPIEPIYKNFKITLMLTDKADDNDKIFAKYIFICNYLFEEKIPCFTLIPTINYSENLTNSEELNDFIKKVYKINKTYLNENKLNTNINIGDNSINYTIFSNHEEVISI